ncbi:hypothetical protein AA102526_1231 [Asaia lannensis NBRC 102526]|nr:hypothetical protein AA102526_1231 [Asaia lannensis NBRC 102526]
MSIVADARLHRRMEMTGAALPAEERLLRHQRVTINVAPLRETRAGQIIAHRVGAPHLRHRLMVEDGSGEGSAPKRRRCASGPS